MNTASQENLITAKVVSLEGDIKILKINNVLIDTGAIHYNLIKLDVVRKYKFKIFKLKKKKFLRLKVTVLKRIHGVYFSIT